MTKLEFPGHGLDSQYLHAVMVYPNDELAQGRLLASAGGHYVSEGHPENTHITISAGLLQQIANSGAYTDEASQAAAQASHGVIAGDILVVMARMTLSNHSEPSLRKAISVTRRYYDNATNANGKQAPSSPQKLKEYLEEFKSVIHLWSAYRICATPNTVNYMEDFDIHKPDNMSRFLGIAEWFRSFAETYTFSRQPIKRNAMETLVQEGALYTFDDNYPLLAPTITWANLEDWMTYELENYTSN